MSLCGKGIVLASQRQWQDSLDTLDELLERFGESRDERVQATIARALAKKAWLLYRRRRKADEAVEIYRQVIDRFGDATDTDTRETVASAMSGLAVILGTWYWKPAEAIPVAEDVITRFGGSPAPGFRKPVRAARRVRRISRLQLGAQRLLRRGGGHADDH